MEETIKKVIYKIFGSLNSRSVLCLLRGLSLFSKRANRHKNRVKCIVDDLHTEVLPRISGQRSIKNYDGTVAYFFHSLGYYHPSGYAARSEALLQSLRARGVTVSAAIRPSYPWDLKGFRTLERFTSMEYRGICFTLFPESHVSLADPEFNYIQTYGQYAARFVKDTKSSLIHASSNYLNGAAAALAGQSLGVPSVYEVRGLWHLTRAFYFPGYKGSDHYRYCEKRELEACRGVDHVITLSDALKAWLVAGGIPVEKVTVVGNAAPTKGPVVVPESEVQALRQYYGLDGDRAVIGYIGSVVEYEGLNRLITLLAATAPARRPWLMVVGDGKSRKTLIKQARQMGVEKDVVFAGRIAPDQVASYYALFDMAALPRRDSELTRLVPPIKPFEIVAHGCPLLVSEPVATALGSTLANGYRAVDFDVFSNMNELVECGASVECTPQSVPTWDERAKQILSVYRLFSGSITVE